MHQNKRKRSIPTKLTENQLAQFILKSLSKRQRGPVSKTSILHGDGTSTVEKRGGGQHRIQWSQTYKGR